MQQNNLEKMKCVFKYYYDFVANRKIYLCASTCLLRSCVGFPLPVAYRTGTDSSLPYLLKKYQIN
jgi:hypothetical protein